MPMKSKKIIIASTDISTGGLGSYLTTLIWGLKSRGWDIHLLVTNARGDYFDEMNRNFNCYDLSSVPLSPKKVFMAASLANSIIPDVILTNNCALMHYALPLIDPKIKPIAVLHSDDSRFYAISALFSNRLYRWVAPTIKLNTQFQRFISEKLHNRIRVIPHGVDLERFFPDDKAKRAKHFQILFVGFLGESKGADLLPNIFEKVAAIIPNAFFKVVGDGPLRMNLAAEFEKRGLEKKVTMCGLLPPEQTADSMRASHILLLPTNLESFGMVIVEAMLCGVVPVVSRLIGITDQLVQHGETGFLIEPLDVDGFVEAIKKIHHDKNLYQAMSSKARIVAAQKFSIDEMGARYESLFSEADDRQFIGKRSIPRWYAEAGIQFLRKRLR